MKKLTILLCLVSNLAISQSTGGYVLTMTDGSVRLPANSVVDSMISNVSIGKVTNLQSTLDGKQATLISATNIKTINGASILGSGDLVVAGQGGITQQTLNDSTAAIRTDLNSKLAIGGNGSTLTGLTKGQITGYAGYSINVQALTSSPGDGATVYFGMLPKAPTTTANISKIYIRQAGTITAAEVYCYSGTAGTNEAWSLYIRVNNTTDNLIATLSVNTNERVFTNSSLSIVVNAGDYIEIKGVQPTWSVNPATTIYGGYIKIN